MKDMINLIAVACALPIGFPQQPAIAEVLPQASIHPAGNSIEIGWPSVAGEIYRLQHSTNLLSTNWACAGSCHMVLGDGSTQTVSRALEATVGFFRIAVLNIPNNPFQVDELDIAGFPFTGYRSGNKRIFYNPTLDLSLQFSSPLDGAFQYSLHEGKCPDEEAHCPEITSEAAFPTVESLLLASAMAIYERSIGVFGDPRYNGDAVLHFDGNAFNRYLHQTAGTDQFTRFRNVDLGIEVWFDHVGQDPTNEWRYRIYTGDWVGGSPPSDLSPYLGTTHSAAYSVPNVFVSLTTANTWINENAAFVPLNTPEYQTLAYEDFEFARSDNGNVPTFFQWTNDVSGAIIELAGNLPACGGCWKGEVRFGSETTRLTDGNNAKEMIGQLKDAVLELLSGFTQGNPWGVENELWIDGKKYVGITDGGSYHHYNQVYYSSETALTIGFFAQHRKHSASVYLGHERLYHMSSQEKTPLFEIRDQYANNAEGTALLLNDLAGRISGILRRRLHLYKSVNASATTLKFRDYANDNAVNADGDDVLTFLGEPFEISHATYFSRLYYEGFFPIFEEYEMVVIERAIGAHLNPGQNPVFLLYRRPIP